MNAKRHTTWEALDTREGQLLEMTAAAAHAKGELQALLEDYPEEAYGSAWLEQAIGLIGRCEDEIADAAAEEVRKSEHRDCGNCGGELLGARDDYRCKDCGMAWYVTESGSREPRGKS